MQELKRIIWDKRFLCTVFFLLVLNAILFYREIKPAEEAEEYNKEMYGGDYRQEFELLKKQQSDIYAALKPEEAGKELQQLVQRFSEEEQAYMTAAFAEWDGTGEVPDYRKSLTEEERRYQAVILSLNGEYNYTLGYQQFIQDILDRAEEQKKEVEVFEADSFAGRNIRKTEEDFARIKDVQPEIGEQEAFNAVCNYNLSDFLMVFGVMAAMIVILDERRKGLWEFVYSMPGGRRKLAAKRIFCMALVSFLLSSLLYLENLIFAGGYLQGYGDLFRPVQSMEICEKVVWEINVLEYLMLVFFWKFLLLFFLAVLLLLLTLSLKNHVTVFLLMAAALAGEYSACMNIDSHSKFRTFKYVNIFAWMDVDGCLRNYLNLNVFGYPVSLYHMMCICVLILLAVSVFMVIWLAKIRPSVMRDGRVKKLWLRIAAAVKPYRHGSLFLMEFYKQFMVQKMWLIVLLAGILAWYSYDDTKVYYDYQGTLYNEYMKVLSGRVTEEKRDYLEQESAIWQEKLQEQEELLAHPEGLNHTMVQTVQSKMKQYEQSLECVSELSTEVLRLLKQREKGDSVCIVNNYAYEQYLGSSSKEEDNQNRLLLLAFCTLLASVLFTSENAQNSRIMIHSTQNGRKKYLICKYAVLLLEEGMVFLPLVISRIASVHQKYGFKYLQASIRSLPFASDFFVDISIWGAILLMNVLTFLILYLVTVAQTLLIWRIKNVIAALILLLAIFVIPAALYVMGFSSLSAFTVLNELVVSGWLF